MRRLAQDIVAQDIVAHDIVVAARNREIAMMTRSAKTHPAR